MTLLLLFLVAAAPFYVRIVDDQTGRGVPLIELRTRNELRYYTDSNGVAVVDEPALTGQRVFFKISGHGYEFTKKVFDDPGVNLMLTPGTHTELSVKRLNIAERLYRLTGEGIYHDSVLAGLPVPLKQPLLNGLVTGQDTAIATPYAGKLFWCWGDTLGPAHMNFNVSCATASTEGLNPDAGIDFTYFVDRSGFAKRMLPLPRPGLVWLEGLFTIKDESGRERLAATYTRQQGLKPPDERGIAIFNDARNEFQVLTQLPWRRSHISSHPFRHKENGKTYLYFYSNQRVPDDWKAIQNPKAWEALTPEGKWTAGAEPEQVRGASSVAWNEYRKKWILLSEKTGTIFYSESDKPSGPWGEAKVILTHNQYNFYNVVQHPFLDREGGRVIYFEGTYTDSFSGAKDKTPRYNYNQIMYRLRLDDPRLAQASAPEPKR